MCLTQVRWLRRPVVHLYVDIGVNIRIPRTLCQVTPDALQVAWRIDTATGANLQITAILEIELFQEECFWVGTGIRQRIIVVHQGLSSTTITWSSTTKLQFHTPHITLEVVNMVLTQGSPSLGFCGSDAIGHSTCQL